MPLPMIAPMPRAVRLHGPNVFLSWCSGSSDSAISLSIDFRANSWDIRPSSPLGYNEPSAVLIRQPRAASLPLARAAHEFLHLALGRAAGVRALLERTRGGALLAGRAFCFFPFVFCELLRISHDFLCDISCLGWICFVI